MRLSELVGINLTDFNDNMTSLVVTGKGAKQRVIYLNSACRAALNDYLAVREQKAHERGRSIADDSKMHYSSAGATIVFLTKPFNG